MSEYLERTFKSIINKKKFIDSWFWDRYSLNPYNGCFFGCVYCDARSSKYAMPEDFENQIIIKQNVGKMLDKRISNARTFLPDVVAIGGVTDAYQPAENKYHNTRQCLEILAKHRYPVHLVTKSTTVLRDLELLDQIGKESWCCVSVTITGSSPKIARFLDNKSPPPAKRYALINEIKKRAGHVRTGVLVIPLIPYLCDSEGDLDAMVKLTKDSGADYLLFGGGMTLRDQQALWFLKRLRREFPEVIPRYEQLYDSSTHPGPIPVVTRLPWNICFPSTSAYLSYVVCTKSSIGYRGLSRRTIEE